MHDVAAGSVGLTFGAHGPAILPRSLIETIGLPVLLPVRPSQGLTVEWHLVTPSHGVNPVSGSAAVWAGSRMC